MCSNQRTKDLKRTPTMTEVDTILCVIMVGSVCNALWGLIVHATVAASLQCVRLSSHIGGALLPFRSLVWLSVSS